MEKPRPRRYPRLSAHVAVDCTAGAQRFHTVASTLGGGGLFLTNAQGLEPGQEVTVHFRPAKHLPLIHAKASVRYIAEQGAAVEFTEISGEDRHKLLHLIHQRTADRRRHPRVALATQIECNECMSLALSRDISPSGMFVDTDTPLPVGSSLTIRFNLDNRDSIVTATAQVVYHVEKMGMGILFTEIASQDRDAIQTYVENQAPPKNTSAQNQSA